MAKLATTSLTWYGGMAVWGYEEWEYRCMKYGVFVYGAKECVWNEFLVYGGMVHNRMELSAHVRGNEISRVSVWENRSSGAWGKGSIGV